MTALQKTKQAELIYLIYFLIAQHQRPTVARVQAALCDATGTWHITPGDVAAMWPTTEGRGR